MMKKLTTEEIKRASKLAVKGYHPPKGYTEETWEAAKLACRRAIDEYVLNTVRNKMEIKESIRLAEKISRGVSRKRG